MTGRLPPRLDALSLPFCCSKIFFFLQLASQVSLLASKTRKGDRKDDGKGGPGSSRKVVDAVTQD
jgi:hypothetical protein